MISKRIRILAIALVSCFCLLSFCMGQQQMSVTIPSSAAISLKRSYICGNYNSTHYYAQNNATGTYELISTDASQTISYAISKLTPGRAWQETVLLKGSFSIYTTVTLSVSNVRLDFSQASTVNIIGNITAFRVNSGADNNTFYGGPYNPFTNTGTHSVWTGSGGGYAIQVWSANCVIDGFEFSGFSPVISASDGSRALTVQNCYSHDNPGAAEFNLLQTSSYHNIINCKFDIDFTGIMVNPHVSHVTIKGCEFLNWHESGGHAIYLDGGGATDSGYCEISGCTFHNGVNGAGCHIKSQYDSIHDNIFRDLTATTSVPISLYSELTGYMANDNDIYNNTFTSCYFGLMLGHETGASPTLQNKVYNNTFTNVTKCFELLTPSSGLTLQDTKIYYNNFHSCATIFTTWTTTLSAINNTVIAYNYFDSSVPSADVSFLQSCNNSMSYQNTFFPPTTGNLAMVNFNYGEIINPASWYYVAPRA